MSPRVDPEERRDEIIQAAMRRFAQDGYHGTSMDDIVAEVGLSKGTLYWYFENKQALFVAMLDAIIADMAQAVEQTVSATGSVSERLRGLVSYFLKVATEQREFGDLLLTFWAEIRHDEALITYFREVYQSFIDTLEDLFEEGIASGEFRPVASKAIASSISAMFDGLYVQIMLDLPIEDTLDTDGLVDWMLNGLLPR